MLPEGPDWKRTGAGGALSSPYWAPSDTLAPQGHSPVSIRPSLPSPCLCWEQHCLSPDPAPHREPLPPPACRVFTQVAGSTVRLCLATTCSCFLHTCINTSEMCAWKVPENTETEVQELNVSKSLSRTQCLGDGQFLTSNDSKRDTI